MSDELRSEEIIVKGRKIKIHELSFISTVKLTSRDSLADIYKESMSSEDYDFLSTIHKNEGKEITAAISRLNGWDKKKENPMNSLSSTSGDQTTTMPN